METKLAEIYRDDKSKAVIDLITLGSKHEGVEWFIKEDVEFDVVFLPEKDPFEPGVGRSKGHKLHRKLKGGLSKGHREARHYQYKIVLTTGEEVKGKGGKVVRVDSPPEMVIQ